MFLSSRSLNTLFSRSAEQDEETLPENPDEQTKPPDSDESSKDGGEKEKEDRPSGGEKGKEEDRKEYRAGNCNDCNRQFCLDYNLPICKNARVEDVFTQCFRTLAPDISSKKWGSGRCVEANSLERDSAKDEAVVFIFIFATAGLLIWAGIRPWVGRWIDVSPSVVIIFSTGRWLIRALAERERKEKLHPCV